MQVVFSGVFEGFGLGCGFCVFLCFCGPKDLFVECWLCVWRGGTTI